MLCGEGKAFTATRLEGDDVSDEWLELRREGIGGSDVAPIMGLSPWTSPLEVWLDKTKRSEPEDISGKEAVAMGTELEADVFDMYRRRHPEMTVRRCNAVLRSVERPWAQASLDGIARDPELGWGVLEIKTGSSMARWDDGVPVYYLTQVLHYLSVTGYKFADVAALIGDHGLHYKEFRVVPDDADMKSVTEAVDEFWNERVLKDVVPPQVTALPSESRAIYEQYKRSDGEMTPSEAFEAEALAMELKDLNASVSEVESRKREISNRLKRLVGEHKGIVLDDYVVTWVRSEKRDSGIRVKEKTDG